ncbi:MAG TPA: flagellar biosynthesis protein FlhF [Cellvibrionaceae bacterium]|nr:flagellar biosynthesis protein FlhF [Cellvibrionaceae bacterium]
MTVKRFVAPDMRRALDLVRQEMGPEAIILSSKRIKEGVEILTADQLDIPTRGYDARKQFGEQFDSDLDRPLISDRDWQPDTRLPAKPQAPLAPPVNSQAERAVALAKEIEAARARMLAAKKSAQAANRPIGELLAGQRAEPSLPPAAASETVARFDKPNRIEPRVSGLSPAETADPFEFDFGFDQLVAVKPAPLQDEARPDGQLANLAAQVGQLQERAPVARSDDTRLNALQAEIADMRSLLERHLRHWPASTEEFTSKPSAGHYALGQQLQRLGIGAELVERLCQHCANQPRLNLAWREALNELVARLPVQSTDPIDQGGVFAFVGPTGVGKTTTIAKLAARYVLAHGQGKVALVTTDTYRVGAQDQLRSLGRILNVPVRIIDQERALPSVLASLKAYPLILIDTAGFRQGDPLLREQEAILAACPSVQRVLVMAGNSQVQTLKASAHAYKARRLAGCVLTKIDETASLGEAISVVIQQAIPLLYTTFGQEIPKDIAVASAQSLVAKAVNLAKQESAQESSVGLS